MRVFGEIAAEIEEGWGAARHDEAAFPALVVRVLRDRLPRGSLTTMDVAEWALQSADLPRQRDARALFGEPPIMVYDGARFQIQVLCWLGGTTAIHRHRFVGGFVVLEGLNLHTTYRFDPRSRIAPHLEVGDVRLTAAELLGPGDAVPITPELKHNVFHLETGSSTVVVRSRPESPDPQLDYFPPSVAFDPFNVDATLVRRVQVLRLLLRGGHARHDELAARLIETSDLATAWDVLEQSYNEIDEPGRAARLAEIARLRHGRVVDELVAVIEEERRKQRAMRLWASLRDPELRFFLALLHSVPHREAILDLVRRRYPEDDPRARVRAWTGRLSGVDAIGVDLSDEANGVLFDALMDGAAPAEVLGRLGKVFEGGSVAARADEVFAHCRRMEATVLAPLFRTAGA